MNRNIFLIVLLGIILILSSCKGVQEDIVEKGDNTQIDEEISEKDEEIDEIEQMIKTMTVKEKIGQLMIFGLNGTETDEHIKKMIIENHIGGIILFKYNISNPKQTIGLLNSLKEANIYNPIPLFLSIDEEGGKVSRLSDPFFKLPEAKKIGDIDDKEISLEYGKILGRRIKSLGFNMDFAPVLDVNSNPKNPVIGSRAFGSTIDTVVNNGLKVMKGINSEYIISIIKHFPGHGDTDMDSHMDMPIVKKDLEELESLELIPFIEGINRDVDGIMVGHILYSKLDKTYPATLSKEIITNLLREKLSYDGVVISDDMTMGAIIKNYSIEDASTQFLKSGGDILLICHGYENQIKVIDKIKEEVEKGTITEEELNKKVYRIIKLKQKYEIEDNLVEDIDIESINDKTRELLDKIKGLYKGASL